MTKTYEDLSQNVVVASPANRLSATRRATLAGMVGSLAAPVTASAATVGHSRRRCRAHRRLLRIR